MKVALLLLSLMSLKSLNALGAEVDIQEGAVSPLAVDGQVNVFSGDQGLLVLSPGAGLDYDVDDRTKLALRYTLDTVSAASFNYPKSKTHVHDHRAPGTCYPCHT